MKFLKLNSGAIISLAHVVSLKPFELRLSTGNTIPLTSFDFAPLLKAISGSNFLRLSNGHFVNIAHIVQFTPPFHIQLTSGSVITLQDDDARKIEEAVLLTSPDSAGAPSPPPEQPAPAELAGSARSQPDPAEPGQTPSAPNGS